MRARRESERFRRLSLILRVAVRQPHRVPWLALARLGEHWQARNDLWAAGAILSQLGREQGPQASWRIQTVERPQWTRTGVTVVMVGPVGAPPERAIKLPHTNEGTASLQRQQEVQAKLHRDVRLTAWNTLVPRPTGAGRIRGRRYFLESVAPGRVALSRLTDRGDFARVQSAAASTIGHLHRYTAEKVHVDARVLDRWIDRRLSVLARIHFPPETESANAKVIHRLRNRLHAALEGQTLQVSWIHGDYWLGNLLLADDRVTPTGIIDWDRAAPGELPWHDIFHLLLYTRRYVAHGGVSEIIALLTGNHLWNQDESEILARARARLPDDGIDDSVMVLLYWLRHTAATLMLYPHYSRDRAYVAGNVEPVLASLSGGEG